MLHTDLGLIEALPLEQLLHVPQLVFQVLQACFCLVESLPDHLADGFRRLPQRFGRLSDLLRRRANLLPELPPRFAHLRLVSETLPLMLRVLATLLGAGFSMEVAHHALHVLDSRIFGFNQDLFEDKAPPPSPEQAALLIRALAPYPRVIEMAQSVSHDGVLGACDDDVEFAFGLDLILDGLGRQLARS